MTTKALLAILVLFSSLMANGKDLKRSDFPLQVEVLSFAKQAYTSGTTLYTPNCLSCTPLTLTWPETEVRINVTIDGRPYQIGCTTEMVKCRTMIVQSYRGRWGKHGIEILGADSHGKLEKTNYRILSGGE